MKNSYSALAILLLLFFNACNNNSNKPKNELPVEKPVSVETPETSGPIEIANYSSVGEQIGGWLALGLSQNEISNKLGTPEETGDLEYWAATGTFVQEWRYPSQGITLNMESENENSQKTVMAVKLQSPCLLYTSSNLSIGSSTNQVYTSHANQVDTVFSNNETIVVGSVYDGIVFTLENMQVSSIFLGAAAE